MKEKIEYKGYWWLPSSPEERVAGILTYIPNHAITLELIGTFDSKKASFVAFMDKKPENIIHGFTSDSKEITLTDCHASGSVNLSCPFPIIKYSCQFIIIGKHLEDFKQKCFHKAYVTIPELTHWCPPSALHSVIQNNNEDKIASISISFNSKGKTLNNIQIDDNTKLIIKEGVIYHGDHFSPRLEQYTFLEILKHNDSSIEDFYANIYLFEQFLSLATLQTSICSEISLSDKSVFQELKDGEKLYHHIQIIYVQRGIEESFKSKRNDFLFNYNSIAKQYPLIIKKWYTEKEDIAPIRAHLIDSIKAKRVFSSYDFLIIIQAIEGFCTRFRQSDTLNNMLQMIISEFSSIDRLREDNIIIQQAVDSRHYYSHLMEKSKKPNALDGPELYDLTFKLRKLLICCLLNYIGFDYDKINIILNKSNSNILSR
jgi:hypothetical protein